MLPRKRVAHSVGPIPFFCFWRNNGPLPTTLPSIHVHPGFAVLPRAQLLEGWRQPAFPALVFLSNATPRSRGRPPLLIWLQLSFEMQGPGLPASRSWQCSGAGAGRRREVRPQGRQPRAPLRGGYENTAVCSGKDKGCEGPSSATGWSANSSRLLERAGFPPDSLIRNLFQRAYTLSLAVTVVSSLVFNDLNWVFPWRPLLAPSREQKGCPRATAVDPMKDTGEKLQPGPPYSSPSPLLHDVVRS